MKRARVLHVAAPLSFRMCRLCFARDSQTSSAESGAQPSAAAARAVVSRAKSAVSSSTSAANLDFVAQLINKALSVAELILRDDKYRVVVKDTPDLINRILSLLNAVQTAENKRVLVKLIAVLGENSANKLEIGAS